MRLSPEALLLWNRRARYRRVFASPDGQRVLADLLRFCRVNQPVLVPGDPQLTAYHDGQRRVGLRLLSILGMDDQEIFRLAKAPVDQPETEES